MKIDDHWLRPRTKAGTEEMRKRLNAMRELIRSSAIENSQNMEAQIVYGTFKEYFTFDWE
jgi:hypothetical protein